jgi:hypothetical protein
MKASSFIAGTAIGIIGGYAICTVLPLTSDDGCATSSAPFTKIDQADAERYAHNYTPDPAIQPTTAFLLTSDIIKSLAFINDSLGAAGVRVYFASTESADDYNSFVAIGIDEALKDIAPTDGKNLFLNRTADRTTIDVCPKMCDTSSPLNHD